MSEGLEGLLVLVLIAVVVAAVGHWLSASYLTASMACAAVAAVGFAIASSLHAGEPDMHMGGALLFGGIYSFIIALIVGLPFKRRRARRNPKL